MIFGVILARGGSKGLPGKNILPIAGFPLIYWTIQAAKQSKLLDDFVVSTEDPVIADCARNFGARVMIRPCDLAQDDTTTLAVLQHIAAQVECNAVVVLQPTSPLRNHDTIDNCIKEFLQGNYDTLATGYYTKIIEYATHRNLRRQDIPGFFYDDGNVYILNKNVIKAGKWYGDTICRKVNEPELNVEIDDATTFTMTEALLRQRLMEGRQKSDILNKLAKVKIMVMDVDGVLTDGGMYYSANGDELKKFNTRDGMGISIVQKAGLKTAFISSENSDIVYQRAYKLSIDHVHAKSGNKMEVLGKFLEKEGLSFQDVVYVGDDINDLDVMQKVGVAVTVPDGNIAVKNIAHYITKAQGGNGAVREVCDLIMLTRNP